MDRVTQVALNSMRLYAENQKITASNLANQNTLGFRADLGTNVGSVYLKAPQSMEDRVFATRGAAAIDTKSGTLIPTDRALDVAVDGAGYIAGTAGDGSTVLTRRGDLTVDPNGVLRNGDRVAIQGDTGPITIPAFDMIQIGQDGTISIVPQGAEAGSAPVIAGRIQLVSLNQGDIVKGLDGNLRPRAGVTAQPDANVKLSSNFLETSNVNTVESMIEMIESSRAYEMKVKMLATVKELDSETAKLMRPSS
jgi:flagellar basal-body rod protein FlgF